MTSASTTAGPEPVAPARAAAASPADRAPARHLLSVWNPAYATDAMDAHVADLGEITGDDPRNHPDDRARMPDDYRDLACDAWFQIWDLRRVVANDTTGVIEALRPLRNTRYHDRPVSLYGGMVDLPLIVWRDPEADSFEDRRALIEDRLWVEPEGEWTPFLASAEAVLRARREDVTFDFGAVAAEYAKAVETELNALLFPLLRRAWGSHPAAGRRVHITGRCGAVEGLAYSEGS
jgi:hypothetical protein